MKSYHSSASHPSARLSIPERAARLLTVIAPAISGSGGQNATYAAAQAVGNGFALDEETTLALLVAHYNPRCVPPWSVEKLRRKVRDALANPDAKGRGYLLRQRRALPTVLPTPPSKPKRRGPDLARIAAIVEDGPTALQLWERSPVRLAVDDGSNCVEIVRALFADGTMMDPLLCLSKNTWKSLTRPLSSWLAYERLSDFSFVVPAYMTAPTGLTKEGKLSEHSLANTGPRRFVVVEFDFAEKDKTTGTPTIYAPLIARWREHGKSVADACAALLWHLDGFSPLAVVVHSGNKSLHGFFPVGDTAPNDAEKFMGSAARLGADRALFLNPSQFVRLPGGTRKGGCRQSVFYFAPDAMKTVATAAISQEGCQND